MFSFIRVVFFVAIPSILLCAHIFANPINKDLVNKNVDRSVDLTSQLVKIHTKITLENAGKSAITTFIYAVEPSVLGHLCFIGASKPGVGGGSEDDGKIQLVIKPININQYNTYGFWEITLPTPLEAGRTTGIEVETVFSHTLVPHPSHITQSERQLVSYRGNLYHFSPYITKSQTTNIALASSNVETFTKTKPFSHSDTAINYGPYESIDPFTQAELFVHYENNNPFLVLSNLERIIELSHWGNIAIEESVDLTHKGAILKGSFSRYEYQREQSGVSSVKSFKQVLPAAATDIYYRDEIGNISTSHLRVLEDAVEIDLRPRFPLFGGWKTHYLLGYNLPSYEYLFNNGEDYALKIRFIDHIFDDMLIEHAAVKVILPEGSHDITLKMPYDVDRAPDELHFTYLDTKGRVVVILHKKNLVENHIQDFELHYKFQKLLMLQEPLLVVIAFYLLFLLVIIYVRLDFSISPDKVSEGKLRIASMCEQVQHHQDKAFSLYQQFDSAFANFKTSKDNSAFQTNVKKLNAEHKTQVQALQELHTKLKNESSDVTDKVNELLKLDKQLKELYASQTTHTEKVVSGKMKKDTYIGHQQTFDSKKDDLLDKMNAIVNSL